MRIALLGPMVIDGRDDHQRRDCTVLGVLLVRDGSAVSTDELADALWGTDVPPSYRKVIQGSVVRLRRALGQGAIRTTGGGYRLDLPAADTDAGQLEAALAQTKSHLDAGHPERAVHVIRDAIALWRGRPLPELDGWLPAETEAARLVQMQEHADDLLIESLLLAGHIEEAAVRAAPLAETTPYREHRWALWARALYAAGRQAEALDALARLRLNLTGDLGIDPGSEVTALEIAILRQDPALAIVAAPAADAPCPWPGLLAYESGDALFGRDADISNATDRLQKLRALVVVGRSGVGKSSFARAGLAPILDATVITPGSQPMHALSTVSSADVIVDQAEELITQCEDLGQRSEFLDRLTSWPGRVVLVVRSDLLDDLAAHEGFTSLLERGLYVLRPLDEVGLRVVAEGPAAAAGLRLEPGLVDLLLAECRHEPGTLPLLSHALAETWARIEGNTLTVAGYTSSGGIREAVATTAERVYLSFSPDERDAMRGLFRRLVSTDEGEPVRTRVAPGDFSQVVVERLLSARLLAVADDGSVQLAHESLARHWPRLGEWLAEDAEGQRLLRHLSREAGDWDATGRSDDALYRGARLDAALAWAATHHRDLRPVEKSFLDASREAAEGELRSVRRANNRLKIALAAAGVLAAVAISGAGLAVYQEQRAENARDQAREASATSESLRLGALAAEQSDPAVAFGLAVEALSLDDSEATRTQVLETFDNFAALNSTGEKPREGWPPASDVAVSADGRLRATATLTHVTITDTGTGQTRYKLAAPSNLPTALAFSPSGDLLAAGMSEPGFAGTGTSVVWDTATGALLRTFDSGDGAVWAHAFDEDESSLWSYGADGTHQWDLTGSHSVTRTQFGDPTNYRADDVVLSVWGGPASDWIDLACELAGRPLTSAEWQDHMGTRPYQPNCR